MLELIGLRKRYGEVVALDGLTLRARPGRIVGFLGPNGAGKTTAMRAVFGLLHLDDGAVSWHHAPIGTAERARFGYMPEQRGLYPRMPVGAQLEYLARLHGVGAAGARRSVAQWLDTFGLADRATDRVSQLSHGNQQRVQLAAALVHDPELLVLDEPFSGLDPLGVAAMSDVLRRCVADGATVVFSSHQLDLVEDVCDDVVVIAGGRDRICGTLEEVRDAAGYRRARLRLAGGGPIRPPAGVTAAVSRDGTVSLRVPRETDPRALLDELTAQGTVERFSLGPPPLSEVFRDVVGPPAAPEESVDTGGFR